MNLKSFDLDKLSKLTSDYIDELKCLECCKYYIAPATALCGHTLCHTCWRSRRTCPVCAGSLDRKTLKPNLPLQTLTNHVQSLGETFEKLFNFKLDEFNLDTPGEIESIKDPDKNVKDWLTSSQNHFSAQIQNSETFSQETQQTHQPPNPLEISASNIIVHTNAKKVVSPVKVTKVVHVPSPQDDWDKIEPMPDVDDMPKKKENIVGPMDIEPFFVDDSEYTTDHPRRSSRKRDLRPDDSNQKAIDVINKNTSRDSSCENDKKSQKGKQTWNNVKRMRKEFSKLNKKNKNKLNVSIEMVKKTQNVKAISNTPIIATQQVVNIDDNTPDIMTNKENEIHLNSNKPIDMDLDMSLTAHAIEKVKDNISMPPPKEANSSNILVSNNTNIEKINVGKGAKSISNISLTKEVKDIDKTQHNSKEETSKMSFIKKSALCPKNINIQCDEPKVSEQDLESGNSDDIEISIRIGTTVTNIVIKKKNNVQVKINTDRQVQTSLGTNNSPQSGNLTSNINVNNIDINVDSTGNNNNNCIENNANNMPEPIKNSSNNNFKSANVSKTQVLSLKVDKSTSDKKNTASADTGTAQFEITESVEKELSNIMEYETATGNQDAPNSLNTTAKPKVDKSQHIGENIDHLDDLNDLDIFNSGSVKEANVHLLKNHAPSEILPSTVGSKLRTQRNVEKRNRDENTDEIILPKNKKVKVTSQQNEKQALHDSEAINYDVVMEQVFANIDADMEDIRKSQNIQNVKDKVENNKGDDLQDLPEVDKTQVIKSLNKSNTQKSTKHVQQYYNEKHSENVFSILENNDEDAETSKIDKIPQQVVELLTPDLCRNLESSQESIDGIPKTNKSNRKAQEYDDYDDKSVVEETPQKDLSIPKLKRASTTNLSQITETRKISSKVSGQSIKSIINLTDTVTESSKSNKDVTILEAARKYTLETPLTISKFADQIKHKSTPVARKSLNFDNENDDDPEQTLCPTKEIVKTTQEKEFLSKAFEHSPTTPASRPLAARTLSKSNRKYCLAASCLTASEIANVKILCAQRKWTYVDKYTKDITHLVVGVDEMKRSQRSVKYMCALAASKWIVSFDWIQKCMQSKDIVNEEFFEALDSTGEPGPKRSRICKQKLFQGVKFYCMPPFSVLDVDTLKNMLMAAGGRVVQEMKEVRVTEGSDPALLLAEPEHTQEDRFIYLAMEQKIVPVNYEWVLNSLGSYTLDSIQELLLCPSTLLPAPTARWPHVLLAQDLESSEAD